MLMAQLLYINKRKEFLALKLKQFKLTLTLELHSNSFKRKAYSATKNNK